LDICNDATNPGDSFSFLLKLDIMEVVSSLAHQKTHESFTGPGPVASI